MQVRHFFSLAAILLVATLHFALQWYAWKLHRFEILLGDSLLAPPADYLWKVSSWPMFYMVSRKVQHLHFLAVLVANSLTWGAAFVGAATGVWRTMQRGAARRKKKRVEEATQPGPIRTAPPTRLERIIELNSLLNRRRITEEEYRAMRKSIMREHDPELDSVSGDGTVADDAVTYTVPRNVGGAEHVAWLEEPSRGRQRKRPARQDPRDEPDATAPMRPPVVRGR